MLFKTTKKALQKAEHRPKISISDMQKKVKRLKHKINNFLDDIFILIFGAERFEKDYDEEYFYTYTIDLDKDFKQPCKIYNFENFKRRKEIKNGNTQRNIT